MQDLSNTQALNRYSYVLNNPLSMTDPTGFFFGSVFNAIGNFIGKLFSAVASVFKAALKIPLIRAAVQIVACGSGVIALCVGVSGALELVAGGSISDAIQAMAFSLGSYVTWTGVGGLSDYLQGAMGVADNVFDAARLGFAAVKGAIHGVVGGALSMAQRGDFMDGFVANASGAFAGVMSEGVFGPPRTGGDALFSGDHSRDSKPHILSSGISAVVALLIVRTDCRAVEFAIAIPSRGPGQASRSSSAPAPPIPSTISSRITWARSTPSPAPLACSPKG